MSVGDTIFSERVKNKEERASTFTVDGELVSELFSALSIPSKGTLHYQIFNSNQNGVIDLSKVNQLKIIINEAADLFGTVAIPLEVTAISKDPNLLAGIAIQSTSSPFSNKLSKINWNSRSNHKVERKQNFGLEQFDIDNEETKVHSSGKWTVVNLVTKLKSKSSDYTTETYAMDILYGGKKVYHSEAGMGDYSAPPEFIGFGKLLNDYDKVLVIGPAGMGDCGKVVLFKSDGSFDELKNLPCGIWGC